MHRLWLLWLKLLISYSKARVEKGAAAFRWNLLKNLSPTTWRFKVTARHHNCDYYSIDSQNIIRFTEKRKQCDHKFSLWQKPKTHKIPISHGNEKPRDISFYCETAIGIEPMRARKRRRTHKMSLFIESNFQKRFSMMLNSQVTLIKLRDPFGICEPNRIVNHGVQLWTSRDANGHAFASELDKRASQWPTKRNISARGFTFQGV